jgi:hypothetical protein
VSNFFEIRPSLTTSREGLNETTISENHTLQFQMMLLLEKSSSESYQYASKSYQIDSFIDVLTFPNQMRALS